MRRWTLVVSLVAGLAMLPAASAIAAKKSAKKQVAKRVLKLRTKQISIPSPFAGFGCTAANPEFSAGYAQETSVAVNPRNPDKILVSWIQDGRTSDLVMASRNGGRSFSPAFVPGLSVCTGGSFQVASDPGVAWSANGRTAYFTGIQVDLPSGPSFGTGMAVSRSYDGGFSWSAPTAIQPKTGDFWDLPRLTTHPRKPNRAYYLYNKRTFRGPPGYSLMSVTNDGGDTWSTPQKLFDPQTTDTWPAINHLLVNRDGSLLNVAPLVAPNQLGPDPYETVYNPTQFIVTRSTDGGATFGPPTTIGSSSGRRPTDPVTDGFFNAYVTFPSQTVAPNGDVYVAWPQPGPTSSQITIAKSKNAGRGWNELGFSIAGQAALATIEVAGDGTVGVMYYNIDPASINNFWGAQAWIAISRNRGRTWTQRPLADKFNLLSAGSQARPCCFIGDYLGIARLPNGLAASFSMGKPQAQNQVDAYFTRVTTSKCKKGREPRGGQCVKKRKGK